MSLCGAGVQRRLGGCSVVMMMAAVAVGADAEYLGDAARIFVRIMDILRDRGVNGCSTTPGYETDFWITQMRAERGVRCRLLARSLIAGVLAPDWPKAAEVARSLGWLWDESVPVVWTYAETGATNMRVGQEYMRMHCDDRVRENFTRHVLVHRCEGKAEEEEEDPFAGDGTLGGSFEAAANVLHPVTVSKKWNTMPRRPAPHRRPSVNYTCIDVPIITTGDDRQTQLLTFRVRTQTRLLVASAVVHVGTGGERSYSNWADHRDWCAYVGASPVGARWWTMVGELHGDEALYLGLEKDEASPEPA